MSEEAERWKEKYLKGIEQQDKLERRWNARLDLLRRGLVRSSLAAEGTDKAVDLCMKEMREIVRKDDMDAGLAGLIPRLEKAVLDSEQRREVRVGQISSALAALVTQLQTLPLPRDVSKPLKRFAKDLEERAGQARELPLLLSELSGLQGRALTYLEKDETERPGLLQRLFGSKEGAQPTHDETQAAPAPGATSAPQTAQQGEDEDEDDDEDDAIISPPAPLAAAPIATAKPATPAATIAEAVASAPPVVTAPTPAITPEPLAATEPVPVKAQDEPVAASAAPVPAATLLTTQSAPQPVAVAVDPALEFMLAPTPVVEFDYRLAAAVEGANEESGEEGEDVEGEGEGEFALPTSPEPSYSSVAAHIEETLLGLLNDLVLPEHHRPQAEAMRVRLEHGLNWYELLPILDDLAVLMLAITDGGQHEFEVYLKQLNERLESFQNNLQAASDDHADHHATSRQYDSQLREQVGGLQSSVQGAADLPTLKHILESRLETLIGTMDHHQRQRDAREQEVAAKLQGLSARVATMEQEALGFRSHLEEQRQKALIDPLTNLPNRAAWGERLEQETDRWQKNKSSLLICIFDLDNFKRINDGYGHLAGDKVLKIIATQLKQRLRSEDFIARFGGEEFVMLLPNTTVGTGLAHLEKLRAAVEACPFHFKSEPVTITVSIGVTALRQGERTDVALKRADQALYRAKENGRNRVEQG
ncbi:GGDEF domain-containing protein [Pseudomonas sp. Pseusp122]|uniref:GGDEF domain-containing protein n=1 Tax=unclassified Pseudomonas TaxID=196821 RepID=UPI0039A68499